MTLGKAYDLSAEQDKILIFLLQTVCGNQTKHVMQKNTGGGCGGGMNWEIGIDIYTLICIK